MSEMAEDGIGEQGPFSDTYKTQLSQRFPNSLRRKRQGGAC